MILWWGVRKSEMGRKRGILITSALLGKASATSSRHRICIFDAIGQDAFMSLSNLTPAAYSEKVAFQRAEMQIILNLYGRMVIPGEAKDYAIGMYRDRAIFAIHKRASEQPSWRIEKVPALANRQGQYEVYGAAGQILKRGHDLAVVLRIFDRKRFEIVQ